MIKKNNNIKKRMTLKDRYYCDNEYKKGVEYVNIKTK